jgi:hypothetical protein
VPVLFSRRRRLAEIAALEAAGNSFWSSAFENRVRIRLWQLIENAATSQIAKLVPMARRMILESEGKTTLTGNGQEVADYHSCITDGNDELVPDLVEAFYWAFSTEWKVLRAYGYDVWSSDQFEWAINQVLYEYRIAYELIEGRMVERESQELHDAVVAPTIRLLSGRQGFAEVEDAYQDALKQLAQGDGPNAITDAARALQLTLTALGCDGNAVGPLLASARKKGLLAAHDARLTESLVGAIEWASADRSQKGDTHTATDATRDDAWLSIHVVGALILRLVSGARSRA